MPAALKWGLIGFALLLLAAIAYVFTFVSADANRDAVASTHADALDVTPVPADIKRRDATGSRAPAGSDLPVRELDKVRASIQKLDTRLAAIESSLSSSGPRIQSAVSATETLDTEVRKIAGELARVATQLDETASNVDGLGVRFAAQDEQITKINQRLAQTRKSSARHARPAFSVLSIDRWGGRDSAVLELNGQVTTASIGDSRAGWTLLSIQRPGCIDVERESDRKHASVCISKGGI